MSSCQIIFLLLIKADQFYMLNLYCDWHAPWPIWEPAKVDVSLSRLYCVWNTSRYMNFNLKLWRRTWGRTRNTEEESETWTCENLNNFMEPALPLYLSLCNHLIMFWHLISCDILFKFCLLSINVCVLKLLLLVSTLGCDWMVFVLILCLFVEWKRA